MPARLDDIRAAGDDQLTEAEQEAAEAASLVTTLEDRVRDGDDSVTAEEIASARELKGFAKLRAEAAQRKAAKAKESARLAALGELAAEIRDADPGRKKLADAFAAFETALGDLVKLAGDHNRQLTAWRTRAAQLGIQPGQTEAGVKVGQSGAGITVDSTPLAPVPTGTLLSGAIHRATIQDRQIKHHGQPLAVRCPDAKDGHSAAINDLSSLLPATVRGGA